MNKDLPNQSFTIFVGFEGDQILVEYIWSAIWYKDLNK